jgi:hypothetical protein
LRIEDIIWPPDGEHPYFLAVGKTGKRTIWITRFQEYVREWIEQHPKRAIRSSYLFYGKKSKEALTEQYMNSIYTTKLKPYFSKLLDDAIGQEDRNQIIRLLQKPWNLYVLRHSAATEVFRKNLLSRDLANQHFGWSEDSNTAAKYEHLFQDDAEKRLAEALGSGIVKREAPKVPRHIECPKCKYQNIPDAPFCTKCRIPLSVSGHVEREQEFNEMKQRMAQMQQDFESYDRKVKDAVDKFKDYDEWQKGQIRFYKSQFHKYAEHYGGLPLTDETRRKLGEFLEQLRANPNPDTEDDD